MLNMETALFQGKPGKKLTAAAKHLQTDLLLPESNMILKN